MTNSVWYIGTSDIRVIKTASWTQLGSLNQADAVWNAANGWGIPVTFFNQNALDWMSEEVEFGVAATDPLGRTPQSAVIGALELLTKIKADTLYEPIGGDGGGTGTGGDLFAISGGDSTAFRSPAAVITYRRS
jgi:hypothetical protein